MTTKHKKGDLVESTHPLYVRRGIGIIVGIHPQVDDWWKVCWFQWDGKSPPGGNYYSDDFLYPARRR